MLILAALGILLTVFILILFHKEGKPKANAFIVTITICASKMVCSDSTFNLSRKDRVSPMRTGAEEMETTSVVSDDFALCAKNGGKGKKEAFDEVGSAVDLLDDGDVVTWKAIARVLDRFCFFVFLIVTVAMNFSFVVVLAIGGRSNVH